MLKGTRLGGAFAIVVAALPAGCAGSDALSKEQYASRLSAMCEDFSAREQEIGEPQTIADLVEKGPRILDAFDEAIADEIRTLEAPAEIAEQADRLADLADRQRGVLGELVEAANADDLAKVQELVARNEALNENAGSIARELGATACAER